MYENEKITITLVLDYLICRRKHGIRDEHFYTAPSKRLRSVPVKCTKEQREEHKRKKVKSQNNQLAWFVKMFLTNRTSLSVCFHLHPSKQAYYYGLWNNFSVFSNKRLHFKIIMFIEDKKWIERGERQAREPSFVKIQRKWSLKSVILCQWGINILRNTKSRLLFQYILQDFFNTKNYLYVPA